MASVPGLAAEWLCLALCASAGGRVALSVGDASRGHLAGPRDMRGNETLQVMACARLFALGRLVLARINE